jgi:hypothetical protein
VLLAAGIAGYSRLGLESSLALAAGTLFAIGAGIGVFTPANQKIAYSAATEEEYGVLAAMLSSLGTAAGTIGTTAVVAVMEYHGGTKLWTQGAAFAEAQRFAFAWLLLGGVAGIRVSVKAFRRVPTGRQ